MDIVLLILRLGLALVFATAAAGKLLDLPGSRAALTGFGVPARLAAVGGWLLPAAELAVAAALIPAGSARWAALGALVLLLSFIGGIARALAVGEAPDCHCFGQLHSAPAGRGALARNAGLAAAAAVVAVAGPGASAGLWAPAGILVATLGLVAWRRRRDRRAPAPRLPTGLPVGAPAPDFALAAPENGDGTLADLRSRGRPVALVFMDDGCGPCQTLRPDVERWRVTLSEAMTVAVINDREVSAAYQTAGTPSAVIVSPTGHIASAAAAGAPAIETLIRVSLRRG